MLFRPVLIPPTIRSVRREGKCTGPAGRERKTGRTADSPELRAVPIDPVAVDPLDSPSRSVVQALQKNAFVNEFMKHTTGEVPLKHGRPDRDGECGRQVRSLRALMGHQFVAKTGGVSVLFDGRVVNNGRKGRPGYGRHIPQVRAGQHRLRLVIRIGGALGEGRDRPRVHARQCRNEPPP